MLFSPESIKLISKKPLDSALIRRDLFPCQPVGLKPVRYELLFRAYQNENRGKKQHIVYISNILGIIVSFFRPILFV